MEALPELLGPTQGQLLDLVSLVLARRPHRDGLSQLYIGALHQSIQHGLPHALMTHAWALHSSSAVVSFHATCPPGGATPAQASCRTRRCCGWR